MNLGKSHHGLLGKSHLTVRAWVRPTTQGRGCTGHCAVGACVMGQGRVVMILCGDSALVGWWPARG